MKSSDSRSSSGSSGLVTCSVGPRPAAHKLSTRSSAPSRQHAPTASPGPPSLSKHQRSAAAALSRRRLVCASGGPSHVGGQTVTGSRRDGGSHAADGALSEPRHSFSQPAVSSTPLFRQLGRTPLLTASKARPG